MSCIRIQSLRQSASSKNPTYDTLLSATWSTIELNVGMICICMPAIRRFLTFALPKCFGSTDKPSLGHERDAIPYYSTTSKRRSKHKSILPRSLFNTTGSLYNMVVSSAGQNRVETKTQTTNPQDDELQLVNLNSSVSDTGSKPQSDVEPQH